MLQIMSIFWVVSFDWMGLMCLWTGMWKRCHIFGKSNWQKWMNMPLKGYHWRTWYMLRPWILELGLSGFFRFSNLGDMPIQNLTCIFSFSGLARNCLHNRLLWSWPCTLQKVRLGFSWISSLFYLDDSFRCTRITIIHLRNLSLCAFWSCITTSSSHIPVHRIC